MAGYATGLLEYSDDPLSDATPTYVDRSSYVIGDVSWADGKSRDLDDPQAGSIQFRLRNGNGEWVPNSPDSLYPDSPFLLRRFRWSVNGTAEGIWYVSDWQVTYPAGTAYSEVVVTAVDGFELLSLDNLALLDPPTATTYEDVVMSDQPFAYYKLGEAFGTKAEPVTGPEATYKNTPMLGQEGLIVGEDSTSVFCGSAEGAEASLRDTIHFSDRNSFTVAGWCQLQETLTLNFGVASALGASNVICSIGTSGGLYTASTAAGGTSSVFSTTAPADGVTNHVVATFAESTLRIYIDGVLEGEVGTSTGLLTTGSSPVVRIGNYGSGTGDDVRLQHVAFFEHALTPERILAHYQAGTTVGGFPSQTAGDRIVSVSDNPLWSTAFVELGEHMVHPVMRHGQSRLDEIRAAVKAEMPDTHFVFDGDGNPVYRAWNYNDGDGPLATFGPGGIAYQGLEPVYDSEMFNEVTVGHESAPGEETQHTVTDAASEDEFFRRAHAETGLILSEHHDAIAVAAAILEKFKDPQRRFASLTLNGAQPAARTQILDRQVGDMVRVVGVGVNDADMITTILGRSKTLTAAGHLVCTWTLGRGFNATDGFWHLGIDGFSELGETTVLG